MHEPMRSREVGELGVAQPDLDRPVAIRIHEVSHIYGARQALAGVSIQVQRGEMFGLLGPNGGGKTTLFKILSTSIPLMQGHIRIFDDDLARRPDAIRGQLGVVFQHPSLDAKLTVLENLQHHGHLYGLWGQGLRRRANDVLQRLGLLERRRDLVETLSGGLRRRVELAKALLHEPSILLLDEPSTGLDPGARLTFTATLEELCDKHGVTVLLTTHMLEEAEHCDRVGILHEGRLVAHGAPDELKRRVGGDVVVIDSPDPETLRDRMMERFTCEPVVVDGKLRVEMAQGHAFVRDVVEAFADAIQAVTFGKPTLADVFIHLTGRPLWAGDEEAVA